MKSLLIAENHRASKDFLSKVQRLKNFILKVKVKEKVTQKKKEKKKNYSKA